MVMNSPISLANKPSHPLSAIQRIVFSSPWESNNKWINRQADVVVAFLYGKLEKPIFMRQPLGFEKGEHGTLVCKVEGLLYGLDPAAKIWYDLFTSILRKLQFQISRYDAGLWFLRSSEREIYVTIYVDDLNIFSPRDTNNDWLIATLHHDLDLKDLHVPKKYLGMEISLSSNGSATLSNR